MGIALNLSVALGSVVILTIFFQSISLFTLINPWYIFPSLLSLISFISVLCYSSQITGLPSPLGRFIPRHFILFAVVVAPTTQSCLLSVGSPWAPGTPFPPTVEVFGASVLGPSGLLEHHFLPLLKSLGPQHSLFVCHRSLNPAPNLCKFLLPWSFFV